MQCLKQTFSRRQTICAFLWLYGSQPDGLNTILPKHFPSFGDFTMIVESANTFDPNLPYVFGWVC